MKRNYLTYFSEEWKESTFNGLKFGFNKTPTDYYLRPYWLSLYQSMSYKSTLSNSNPVPCYYDKLLHLLTFEWLSSLHKFYSLDNKIFSKQSEIPSLFGIIKMNEMSHDYLERLFWIDKDLNNLLLKLFTDTFLDNTLFIIMGKYFYF
jgi:hypothetical protein